MKRINPTDRKLKIALIGLGKAGIEIARYLLEQPDVQLVGAFCREENPKNGQDLGCLLNIRDTGVIVQGDHQMQATFTQHRCDAVIDFSTPEATLQHAEILCPLHVRMVIGTTGFTDMSLKRLKVLARKHETGILYAPNITTGVNVLMLLSHLAASILNQYDFQITEIHHSRKKDAPSGTAKKIAMEIRSGLTDAGLAETEERAPILAVRAGGVVGVHEVLVVGEQDQLRISHESFSRRIFAEGALKGARFLLRKKGWFEMRDVLQFEQAIETYLSSMKKTAAVSGRNAWSDHQVPSEASTVLPSMLG